MAETNENETDRGAGCDRHLRALPRADPPRRPRFGLRTLHGVPGDRSLPWRLPGRVDRRALHPDPHHNPFPGGSDRVWCGTYQDVGRLVEDAVYLGGPATGS